MFFEKAQFEKGTPLEDRVTQARSSARVGQYLCFGAASIGLVVFAGWLSGVEQLAILIPGLPPMVPNTAICVAALGIAGGLRRQMHAKDTQIALSVMLAIAVLAIAAATIAEYALQLSTVLDQLFIHTHGGPHPGRPSPPTAVAVALLSAAIALFDWRPAARIRLPEWLVMAAGLIAFTALLGQLFGAGALYRFLRTPVIGVSLPTAVSVLMISAGLLLERSDTGIMRLVTERGPGNVLLLRLVPVAILAPTLVTLISARLLETPGITDVALVFAVLTVVICLANLFLLSITAVRLNDAHDRLERAEAQTHALFEQASEGIFIADLEGRYTDTNDAACRMLGYSRNEIIGKTIMDLIPPEEAGRLQDDKARMLKGGIEVGEWMLRHKNGIRIPVEVSAKILPDGRWQGFVRDISARKRAEEALRLSEAKFSGIVSISADAIVSIDADQRIILFNEGAEKMFGWSNREMIGKPLEELFPERFRAAHRRDVGRFAAGENIARHMGERRVQIYGLRRNGEEFPARAIA